MCCKTDQMPKEAGKGERNCEGNPMGLPRNDEVRTMKEDQATGDRWTRGKKSGGECLLLRKKTLVIQEIPG